MTETQELSVPEAAAHLGRSERTIWRQIKSGELVAVRRGRRVFVHVSELTVPVAVGSDGDALADGIGNRTPAVTSFSCTM